MNETKPLPPEGMSLITHVESEWSFIRSNWERGWHAESHLLDLENYIEHRRHQIFNENSHDVTYDYGLDWVHANNIHKHHMDLVSNRKAHIRDTKLFWTEISRHAGTYANEVSLEALRAMIIINGAAIIACLTLLSGQVENPTPAAITVAKITVVASIISLIMMALGHAIQHMYVSSVYIGIAGKVLGQPRHKRLWAIPRYTRRYTGRAGRWSEALIYGSIFVFGLDAIICALILAFS